MQLILASSSNYRKELLHRLHLPFECFSPDIDETPLPGETAEQLVKRLSLKKAHKVAETFPDALIIGSDQAAVLEGRILGKPGSAKKALAQLRNTNGKTLKFMTGLCLFNSRTSNHQLDMVPFEVQFRTLSDEALKHYIELDMPLDCAGSFKWEQLGIALFSAMLGNDVTSLQGLPLIRLIDMLEAEGVKVL
jgi:7-methyl-GTP pyrophosphatase